MRLTCDLYCYSRCKPTISRLFHRIAIGIGVRGILHGQFHLFLDDVFERLARGTGGPQLALPVHELDHSHLGGVTLALAHELHHPRVAAFSQPSIDRGT
jgi:hypothetical protein